MNKLKIAVVIPTFKNHLPYLMRCLNSIQNQTRLPDIVCISASSCVTEDLPNLIEYKFPIRFTCSENKQNAAFNRNKASELLKEIDEINIISFFDSDDEMLPNRLEFIEKSFIESNTDLVVHNYIPIYNKAVIPNQKIFNYASYTDACFPDKSGIKIEIKPEIASRSKSFALGHCSVKYNLWLYFPFNSSPEYLYREDASFCRTIIEKGFTGSYIDCELSIYHNYEK